jgi:hypothetical protein
MYLIFSKFETWWKYNKPDIEVGRTMLWARAGWDARQFEVDDLKCSLEGIQEQAKKNEEYFDFILAQRLEFSSRLESELREIKELLKRSKE